MLTTLLLCTLLLTVVFDTQNTECVAVALEWHHKLQFCVKMYGRVCQKCRCATLLIVLIKMNISLVSEADNSSRKCINKYNCFVSSDIANGAVFGNTALDLTVYLFW